MKNKLIFLSVILFLLLFSNTGHSQWLVDGGNIFYPYGNVSITNGNFSLSGDLVIDGNLDIYPRLGDYFRLIDNGSSFNFNFATSDFGEGGDDFGQIHFAASPEEGISMIHWSGNPLDGTKSKIHITETYGIDIEGDVTLSDDLTLTGKSRFLDDVYISDGSMSPLNFLNNDDSPFVNLIPSRMGIKLGDVNYYNAGTSILVDDYYQLIQLYSTDSILVDCFGTLLLGDASNSQYGTKISILDNDKKVEVVVGGDKAMDIVNDGTRVHYNFLEMPSDSTNLNTGDLYFNSSTGAVHRKF